jgi:hypothetical protein
MGRLFALFFFADLTLVVIALIDSLSTDRAEVRHLPKFVWVFLILVFSPIGPILWFVSGRPQKVAARNLASRTQRGYLPGARARRPVAPDDDPDFLRNINTARRREDDELLKRFEEDLRGDDDE